MASRSLYENECSGNLAPTTFSWQQNS